MKQLFFPLCVFGMHILHMNYILQRMLILQIFYSELPSLRRFDDVKTTKVDISPLNSYALKSSNVLSNCEPRIQRLNGFWPKVNVKETNVSVKQPSNAQNGTNQVRILSKLKCQMKNLS